MSAIGLGVAFAAEKNKPVPAAPTVFSAMVPEAGAVMPGAASTWRAGAKVRQAIDILRARSTAEGLLAKGGSSMKSPKLEKQTRIRARHAQLVERMPRKWN